MTALTLLLLATVTFDGFSDTPEWAAVLGFFLERTPALTSPYFNGLVIANTAGLLACPLLFAALYRGVAGLMRRAAGNSGPAAGALMAAFVFSLVPIALAYHFAHYLGFLLIQGQLIIPLASDPFGYGWDLFGGGRLWGEHCRHQRPVHLVFCLVGYRSGPHHRGLSGPLAGRRNFIGRAAPP